MSLYRIKKYYLESRGKETSYIKLNIGTLTALVTSCLKTAFWDTLLKEIKGKLFGTGRRKRKVSTYWMTVRKQETIGNWKRNHSIVVLGNLVTENITDLSQVKLTEGEKEILTMDKISCSNLYHLTV